jgi:hypothetical protein
MKARRCLTANLMLYTFIWWRGLVRCVIRGHHLMVFGHGTPKRWNYCWDCFYGFPWEQSALTPVRRFRSWVGGFIPREAKQCPKDNQSMS